MPMVNGKKFPYTAKGKADAKKAATSPKPPAKKAATSPKPMKKAVKSMKKMGGMY
jgi:hypothetical protein